MPIYSLAVVVVIVVSFILVGEINTLAPIVTMPFLLTYAAIDYAYFALAQTFDIQHQKEERFSQNKKDETDWDPAPTQRNDLDYLFPERTRHKVGKASFHTINNF